MNPGPAVTADATATAAQIKQAVDAHEITTRIFRECTLVDKALKQLLLGAVDIMPSLGNAYANIICTPSVETKKLS